MHGLEGVADVRSQQLWVNVYKGVVHLHVRAVTQRFLYRGQSHAVADFNCHTVRGSSWGWGDGRRRRKWSRRSFPKAY